MIKAIFGILCIVTTFSLKISHLQTPTGSGFTPPSWGTETFVRPTFPTSYNPTTIPSFPNPTVIPQRPPMPSIPPSQTFTPPMPPMQMSQEQKDAFARLMNFVKNDFSLNKAMTERRQLDQAEYKKLYGFISNDPFFPLKMANDYSMLPPNEWIKKLSNTAKIQYIKIVTQFMPTELNDAKNANLVVTSLLNDKQLGPAVLARFGPNPTQGIINSLQNKSPGFGPTFLGPGK